MASTKKRSSSKKNIIKGVSIGVGLTALIGLAYKKGLFDDLANNIIGKEQTIVQMEPVAASSVSLPIKPLAKKIQEEYILNSISKVLRKPVTELKAKGITKVELVELRKNNIEIKDIEPVIKIN